MIRAILDNRKTQTRRVAKPPRFLADEGVTPSSIETFYLSCDGAWVMAAGSFFMDGIACPYGQPGDRLWVRETWGVFDRSTDWVEDGQPTPYEIDYAIGYRADGEDSKDVEWMDAPAEHRQLLDDNRWRPSIHMPRWASRITLEVTEVRAQRVQDTTDEDALAEGCPTDPEELSNAGGWYDGPRPALWFSHLWDSINAKRGFSWESNPWVWAVTFRRIEP